MECPRCGDENLPGLARCFSCGQDLAAPVEAPAGFVPGVGPANPLARRRRRPLRSPSPDPLAELARLQRRLHPALPVLRGALQGLIPGLAALRRGDRRGALRDLGVVAVPALVAVTAFRSWFWDLAILSAGGSLVFQVVREARAAFLVPEPRRTVVAALLGLAVTGAAYVAVVLAFQQWRPPVAIGPGTALAAGTYLVAPGELPAWGGLVAFRQPAAEGWYRNYVLVAPLLATAGEEVSFRDGTWWVDGVERPVRPLQPREARWQGTVPEGHVLLLNGTGPANMLAMAPVPLDQVLGRLTWRWRPAAARGPVAWPLEPTEGIP